MLEVNQRRVIWTFCAAIVACVLEGAVRKWLLPPGSPLRYVAYFSKDLILASCLFYVVEGKPTRLISKAYAIVSLGVGIFLIGAISGGASDLNPVGAILTLRACVFLPLVSMAVASRLRRDTYYLVCLTMIAMIAINVPLGALQFFSSPGSWINKYASEMDIATATYAERVRATGTFSYLAGYGVFSCAAVAAGLILISTQSKLRQIQLGYGSVVGGLVCAGATASRSVALGVVAELAVWGVLGIRKFNSILSGLLVVALISIFVYAFEATEQTVEILSSAHRRHLAVTDTVSERIYQTIESVPLAVSEAPFGVGLGTQQIAGTYYSTGRMAFASYEAEWPRIVMEAGVLGLMGTIIVHAGVIIYMLSAWYSCQHRPTRTIYLTCAVVCSLWFVGGVVFNHVTSFFFWVFVTIALSADARDKH